MKELCGIYCIENTVNNKKYIGLSRNVKRRWSEHKSKLKNNCHPNELLQYHWNVYGENRFKFYVVELCDESLLTEKEIFYIDKMQTMVKDKGYNQICGGENAPTTNKPVICLQTKQVYKYVYEACNYAKVAQPTMKIWCKEKRGFMYLSDYRLLSEQEKEYWTNYDWNKAIHAKLSSAHKAENLTSKTRKKLSESLSGQNNPRAQKVYCPQLDETFEYIKLAAKKYGICASSIGSCAKGKAKSAGRHPITNEKLTWVLV